MTTKPGKARKDRRRPIMDLPLVRKLGSRLRVTSWRIPTHEDTEWDPVGGADAAAARNRRNGRQ